MGYLVFFSVSEQKTLLSSDAPKKDKKQRANQADGRVRDFLAGDHRGVVLVLGA